MKQVLEKSRCTGCTACMNICPKGAITMAEDIDGFKYPVIDQDKCINCGTIIIKIKVNGRGTYYCSKCQV